MKRFWPCLMLLATAQPALASDDDEPYYGPMKRWHGVGFKFGYQDRTEKDGSWRIDAAVHKGGDAIDMALYRAAERARQEGYRYVFVLGGSGSKSPGIDAATVYARPSHEAVPPVGCRSRKITTCYTADVAEVLRVLGGPGGARPGVPIVDHRDEYGRAASRSGYGTGGIVSLMPGGVVHSHVTTVVENRSAPEAARSLPAPIPMPLASTPRPAPLAPSPTTVRAPARGLATRPADDRYEQALKATQPVRGGDSEQGWTISD